MTCSYGGWPVLGGCTNITNCTEVTPNGSAINKCTRCVAPKILSIGLCIDTHGCTYVNYTWVGSGYFSFCTVCNSTANFDPNPVNGECVCMQNKTLNKKTNLACLDCPSNCLVCEE